ncbi:MAG TPA: tRNA (adenosine(37)-N6)-threonylcarbamoyltransferase complex transferase subunit TsaD [Candidatus Nanoarchaeia archaeon]|nr:tRNA (adenosine(37)-N6)-threonylcarbamoyltransferase complex transferase subunit TsaD [Candidatus Nanoarchaeia archaeon]
MKILAIETSCDETAVSIIEAEGDMNRPKFTVLSSLVLSQIKIHEQYGGVFPNLAKREHAKNLAPLVEKSLEEAGVYMKVSNPLSDSLKTKIQADLVREPGLADRIIALVESIHKPKIDLIAVTNGPGLEPALWVGINGAKALGEVWGIPVMPINHMEGHISSVLLNPHAALKFPAIALLISGGHTELVLVKDWLSYQIIGETRDDAVGEAYDKVARMLGLVYPGGPKVAQLASQAREEGVSSRFHFPRPMIKSGDSDFSFSGLKTAVLYALKDAGEITDQIKKEVCVAFEDAIVDTLVAKTKHTIETHSPKALIIAGGVIANQTIRSAFESLVHKHADVALLVPEHNLSTDNALMIALAAYVRYTKNGAPFQEEIKAQGNMRLN